MKTKERYFPNQSMSPEQAMYAENVRDQAREMFEVLDESAKCSEDYCLRQAKIKLYEAVMWAEQGLKHK